MAIVQQFSEVELFLMTVENDEEDAPWMVMADLQVRGVDLLKPILLLHAEQQHLPWYVASYLLITIPRPMGEHKLEAAPDLLVAEATDWLRPSWDVVAEGKAPEFVLELSSGKSWGRDFRDKPRIYDYMGVSEYVMFAPERRSGPKLRGWRRDERGQFVEWQVDKRGVLWSRALGGLGLYVEGGLWLRALDATGRRLPTPAEVAIEERRRADAETARADTETARADAETARADAEAEARAEGERRAADAQAKAESELQQLREELRQLRGQHEPGT